jgi:hypothetical protein
VRHNDNNKEMKESDKKKVEEQSDTTLAWLKRTGFECLLFSFFLVL